MCVELLPRPTRACVSVRPSARAGHSLGGAEGARLARSSAMYAHTLNGLPAAREASCGVARLTQSHARRSYGLGCLPSFPRAKTAPHALCSARPVDSDAEVYLLDDVLSAVDAHVGRHLVDHAIIGMMVAKNRTVVLATHQLSAVAHAQTVITLDNGQVSFHGTPQQCEQSGALASVQADGDSATSALASTAIASAGEALPRPRPVPVPKQQTPSTAADTLKEAPRQGGNEDPAAPTESEQKESGKLTVIEDRETGSVSWHVLASYAHMGGWLVFGVAIALLVTKSGAAVACQGWVSVWTAKASQNRTDYAPFDSAAKETYWYIQIYALFSLVAVIFLLAEQLACVRAAVSASARVHALAFRAVSRAPISFFETTPTGRILARFGNDTQVVDTMLMNSLNTSATQLMLLLVVFVMNATLVPALAPISIPLVLVYWRLSSLYRRSSRELKRLENIAETPVYSTFASCMDGLTTIRAFPGSAARLTQQTDATIDDWVAVWLKNNCANRWMGMRLDFIGGGLVGSVGLFSVLWADGLIGDSSAAFSAGLVGLMLSFAAAMSGMLNWMVRSIAEAEQHATSFERCLAMAAVPTEQWGDEPGYDGAKAQLPSKALVAPASTHADDAWPSKGAIELRDVTMRYRPQLPLVLHGITLSIEGGHRVGICGRTGSGKSSLSKYVRHSRSPRSGTPQAPRVLYSGSNRSWATPARVSPAPHVHCAPSLWLTALPAYGHVRPSPSTRSR